MWGVASHPDLVKRNVWAGWRWTDIWSSLTGGRRDSVQPVLSQHEVRPALPPPDVVQLYLSPLSSAGRNGEVSTGTAVHCSYSSVLTVTLKGKISFSSEKGQANEFIKGGELESIILVQSRLFQTRIKWDLPEFCRVNHCYVLLCVWWIRIPRGEACHAWLYSEQ